MTTSSIDFIYSSEEPTSFGNDEVYPLEVGLFEDDLKVITMTVYDSSYTDYTYFNLPCFDGYSNDYEYHLASSGESWWDSELSGSNTD